MRDKLTGVVLNTIKYNDKHSIVRIYTATRGITAFLARQCHTPAARMRAALLLPLSLVEFEANIPAGRDLGTMHDLRRTHQLTSIYADPYKNTITFFVSELLLHTIQEQEANQNLFNFIEQSVLALEEARRGIANFHLCFLYKLGALVGIQPDAESYRGGYWFDMAGGVFTPSRPMRHGLEPQKAQFLHLMSRMTFDNMHLFSLNRNQRNEILDTILSYYHLHNSTLGTLKSPDLLQQIFI